jgi:site-specific recombinase XerD
MKRMQPMTEEQLVSLRKTAKESGAREHALITLMTCHFIRASELAGKDAEGNPTGLKTADLNLKDNTISITRLKGSISTTEALMPGESDALAAWLKIKPESAWLFPGRSPEYPMTRRQIYNLFHDLCVTAGVPMVSAAPHASRHTIGQTMAENGAQAKLIQQAAGHKSLASSGQYYEFRQSHVDSEKARLLGLKVTA